MKRTFLQAAVVMAICVCAAAQSQYEVIHSFGQIGSNDGNYPNGGFVYRAGQLYGSTAFGGANCENSGIPGCGTVFAIESFYGTAAEAAIYSFCPGGDPLSSCLDGLLPSPGGVISDSAGNLYGTTELGGTGDCVAGQFAGCGVVFELTRVSRNQWSESVLYSFKGPDGTNPIGRLTIDATGNLYGTTFNGGAYGAGVVFELVPDGNGGWTYYNLHDFNPAGGDGAQPFSGLTLDSSGDLYGTTMAGGGTDCPGENEIEGCGTLFELMPNANGTWNEKILYLGRMENAYPVSGVALDNAGDVYGTTTQGSGSDGSVFRLTLQEGVWRGSAFFFDGQDGGDPEAAVTLRDGALYGTTEAGYGNVFQIRNRQAIVLHTFCAQGLPCADGARPAPGPPLFPIGGSFYGATNAGGAYGNGIIFRLTP